MIDGARRLSRQHVTVRVPWHDRGWTGHVCAAPSANTACQALARIAKNKRADQDQFAGKDFSLLAVEDLPPCVEERVGFMADRDIILNKVHPYKTMSPETHGHFGDTTLRLEAHSATCVPFSWMLRRHVEGDDRAGIIGKADALRLGYTSEREPTLPFKTSWIQDKHNQHIMLDTFFGALEKDTSLCFFYAKRTPLAEDPRRIIIGVGRVKNVGAPTEYNYEGEGPLKGMLWERNVRHSLRANGDSDGFLMPYHALLTASAANPELDVSGCLAFAPEDQFDAYSYAAEHLDDDAAIASLLVCAAALRATAQRIDCDIAASIRWIDGEIARLWTARGVYPGLGSALFAFGLDHGALLAHEIVRAGAVEGKLFDAFAFIDGFVAKPKSFPEAERFGFGESFREKWAGLPAPRRQLLELVARCNLTAEQSKRSYQQSLRTFSPALSDGAIIANPYALFERDEASANRVSFAAIDRGVFPADSIREAAPLAKPSAMSDAIDKRRVRAMVIDILEKAVVERGHTMLPRSWIVQRALSTPLEPTCPIDEDTIDINVAYLAEAVASAKTDEGEPAYKLVRYAEAKQKITTEVNKRVAAKRHALAYDWRKLVDEALNSPLPTEPNDKRDEERARQEKAAALELLANSRFSVLIGPAGSGKTTLLRVLCELPEVDQRQILLLAPTGKARVRLEEATGRLGQAKTLAQFLQRLKRYDGESGRYFMDPDAAREKGYRTVIVDECSMLTEDQLAALIDALEGVERLVLVGDHRQLPPIGAGKPFVDICRQLAPDEQPPIFPRVAPGYSELTVIGRQRGSGRGDVLLARQFSGEPLDPGADAVWDTLHANALDHVKTVRWPGQMALEATLVDQLVAGLGLNGASDEEGFEASIGGSAYEGYVYFKARKENQPGAAAKSHDWQILSPIRAGMPGVDAINLSVQRRFRTKAKALAENRRYARTPKPMGPQGLLYGDKVINVRNSGRRQTYPTLKDAYVANGDIGVIVGGFKYKGMSYTPKHLEVEFNSQKGTKFTFKSWEFGGDDGSPDLELAYALTVHKTQGSQFGKVFLVVPKHCRPLTRELLYTALTRHQDELVILHEDEISSLRRYAHPSESEIARRMTDLFQDPAPIEVPTATGPTFLDRKLLHRTSRNELVSSKAECAIAEKLIAMGVDYKYELPLVIAGKTRWPDFTIEDAASGITYYWEHCGMLSDPAYAERWVKKRKDYLADGVRPIGDPQGSDRLLIETKEVEGQGLDMVEVERLAKLVLG